MWFSCKSAKYVYVCTLKSANSSIIHISYEPNGWLWRYLFVWRLAYLSRERWQTKSPKYLDRYHFFFFFVSVFSPFLLSANASETQAWLSINRVWHKIHSTIGTTLNGFDDYKKKNKKKKRNNEQNKRYHCHFRLSRLPFSCKEIAFFYGVFVGRVAGRGVFQWRTHWRVGTEKIKAQVEEEENATESKSKYKKKTEKTLA